MLLSLLLLLLLLLLQKGLKRTSRRRCFEPKNQIRAAVTRDAQVLASGFRLQNTSFKRSNVQSVSRFSRFSKGV